MDQVLDNLLFSFKKYPRYFKFRPGKSRAATLYLKLFVLRKFLQDIPVSLSDFKEYCVNREQIQIVNLKNRFL